MRSAIEITAGVVSDDTTFSNPHGWKDASNVRFRFGKVQTIGGWQSITTTLLTGVCRKAFPWTDNSNVLNVAFGTHTKLQIYQGGALYDITPTLNAPARGIITTNPISVTNGSAVVTVTDAGHGFSTGMSVVISGATATATVTINGTWTITVLTTSTYTFTAASNANATTTGGGSAVVVTPQTAFATGATDGTGSVGFGTGTFGSGTYGTASTSDYFPRTWSFGAWGANLLACPRNGTIHGWTNNTGSVAAPLQNAPAQVQYCLVAPNGGGYQVFALGCSQEADGVFNPMAIRHSSVRVNTEWYTGPSTTAREYQLTGGGRIVAGAMLGNYMLVWTNDSLFVGQFVGSIDQPWRFDRVSRNCGLAGPGAFSVKGLEAFWLSPDGQFYGYQIGGQPEIIACPIRDDLVANLAPSQSDKIVSGTVAQYGEVWWFYPDIRDGSPGTENSRYVSYCFDGPDKGAWSRGQMARTAFCDAGPSSYPIGVTYAGNAYWQESGQSADGGVLSWYATTTDMSISDEEAMNVKGIWPDFTEQVGPLSFTLYSRIYPQSTEVTSGPYAMIPSQSRLDFRAQGRMVRIKIAGSATSTFARLGQLDLELSPAGKR